MNSKLEHTVESGIHGTSARHFGHLDPGHTDEEYSYLDPAGTNQLITYVWRYEFRAKSKATLPHYKMGKVHFSMGLPADDQYYICFQVESDHLNYPESVQSTECLQNDTYVRIKNTKSMLQKYIEDKLAISCKQYTIYYISYCTDRHDGKKYQKMNCYSESDLDGLNCIMWPMHATASWHVNYLVIIFFF